MRIQTGGPVRTMRLDDLPAIRSIMEASLARDGIPGFEPIDIERSLIRLPADPEGCLVAEEDERVVGYCIPRFGDLTVHPDHRRRGHGRRLVEAARRLVAARGLPYLQLHGPHTLPPARAFIDAIGARHHSSLWLFELGADVAVPRAELPDELVVRPLEQLELDDVVALMNATFVDHPTPLSWTSESVRLVHQQPDFDPAGVLVLAPRDEPDRLVGMIKVELTGTGDGLPPKGWVALLGVMPDWRGRGLGLALLRWGIAYLRSRGARDISLAAEALNERATQIYRRAGFVATVEWPQYVLPPATAPGASPPGVARAG